MLSDGLGAADDDLCMGGDFETLLHISCALELGFLALSSSSHAINCKLPCVSRNMRLKATASCARWNFLCFMLLPPQLSIVLVPITCILTPVKLFH